MLALLALLQAGRKSELTECGVQAAQTAANDSRWRMAQMQEHLRPPVAASRPLLPTSAAAASLQCGAHSVADVIRLSVSDATLARRNNIFGEFEKFLSAYGVSVMDVNPMDVLLFLDSEYQHEHTGTRLPDGSHVSAPQSLCNARSALAGVFSQQGRSGPWSDTDGSGNPCDSVYVKQYLTGYRNKQTAAGYAEKAAVPYSEDELRQALTAVWQAACQYKWGSLQQCCLLRQGAEVAVGHATALRGYDIAKLRVQDLTTTDGQPIAHSLHQLLFGQKFCVRPYYVKNRQEANAGSVTVTVPPDPIINSAAWLAWLLQSSRAGGAAVTALIFRPLNANRAGFCETEISSSTLNYDVQSVFKLGGVYQGQAAHSLRRSALQHASRRGATTEQLLDMALISTEAVLKRKYLDAGRHVTASQRARRVKPRSFVGEIVHGHLIDVCTAHAC